MTTDDLTKEKNRNTSNTAFPSWWFLPVFIVGGQLLMRLTGYSAWAESVGQQFMFTFIFYMAAPGVLLGGWSVMQINRRASRNAA
jgi:hypothetical protein